MDALAAERLRRRGEDDGASSVDERDMLGEKDLFGERDGDAAGPRAQLPGAAAAAVETIGFEKQKDETDALAVDLQSALGTAGTAAPLRPPCLAAPLTPRARSTAALGFLESVILLHTVFRVPLTPEKSGADTESRARRVSADWRKNAEETKELLESMMRKELAAEVRNAENDAAGMGF